MKKLLLILSITLLLNTFIFAQQSASAANRNTALRCLKLAENCLLGGDWDNAYSQAQLGLSYDDSVSDLIYVKAASSINLGKSKKEVLEIISDAFKKNNWLGYSLNGARILYADLLCDTGDYEASLNLLDSEPFILSADAEFIRVKNYYRLGTEKSVTNARLKVNTARRIYPNDSRFPTLFFMFEYAFMAEAFRSGLHYEVSETVGTIARAYIAKLPDYKDLDNEIEILATFFADEKEKVRLLQAIDSKNTRSHPVMAIAGLRNGIYTDSQAYDLFFSSVGDTYPLEVLQDFALSLREDDVKLQLASYLNNFSGSLTVDVNLDLQNEMIIKYENGRPSEILYDANLDGFNEVEAQCDFGAPVFISYPPYAIDISYAAYPEVSKINYQEEDRVFTFLHEDYNHAPFEFIVDPIFSDTGIDFFEPHVMPEIKIPDASDIVDIASGVELSNSEREGSYVAYASENGKLYFANFYENDYPYAYADFSLGLPFVRHVDSDNDGNFETTEEYAAIPEDLADGFDFDKCKSEIEAIFGKNALSSNIYLKKIQIDRNANTFYEYTEIFYEYDGKACIWDNDDDGIEDFSYVKAPCKAGDALEEAYTFFQEEPVTINFIDGIPVKLTISENEEIIYAGSSDCFYWIAEEGPEDLENEAISLAESISEQGRVSISDYEDCRFSVIKIAGKIFARILPESYLVEE
ncbi:MAG: hypothetical protein K5681_04450 [Treponema sp.]|nr:hypothetical protein [Treponema sp.]